MDLRLVVGGFLTRNAVLCTLLMNYAARIEEGWAGNGTSASHCFIVPTWSGVGEDPAAPLMRGVLTVAAHASRSDPRHDENLDSILRLLHGVLTDDHARSSFTARRLVASADQASGDRDAVVRIGSWGIAPVPSQDSRATRVRLLAWPDCGAVLDTAGLAPATVSLN